MFAETNGIENATELQEVWAGDSAGYANEASAVRRATTRPTATCSLPADVGCGGWVTQDGKAGARRTACT